MLLYEIYLLEHRSIQTLKEYIVSSVSIDAMFTWSVLQTLPYYSPTFSLQSMAIPGSLSLVRRPSLCWLVIALFCLVSSRIQHPENREVYGFWHKLRNERSATWRVFVSNRASFCSKGSAPLMWKITWLTCRMFKWWTNLTLSFVVG